jgi:hypothetical protein
MEKEAVGRTSVFLPIRRFRPRTAWRPDVKVSIASGAVPVNFGSWPYGKHWETVTAAASAGRAFPEMLTGWRRRGKVWL